MAEITPAKVTQRQTYKSDEDCCKAEHAVDGLFSSAAVAQIDSAIEEAWLKLEFSKTLFIHKVMTYHLFYENWYGQSSCCVSVDEFKKCVNNDNNINVSVYQDQVQQRSCGTVHRTYGLKQSDQIYSLICNIEGDTVKLSKRTLRNIAVLEVAVIGTGKLRILNILVDYNQVFLPKQFRPPCKK